MEEELEKAAERLYPTTFVAIFTLKDKVDKNKERRQIFIEGAKSDAAKDYWIKIFKQEKISDYIDRHIVETMIEMSDLNYWSEQSKKK